MLLPSMVEAVQGAAPFGTLSRLGMKGVLELSEAIEAFSAIGLSPP